MVESKLVSSLEKCFSDMSVSDFSDFEYISVLKNERFSFQLIARAAGDDAPHRSWVKISLNGPLSHYATVRTVECIPSLLPGYPGYIDDNFLRTTPGLYPDLLLPPGNDGMMPLVRDQLRSYWITFDLDGEFVGTAPLTVVMSDNNGIIAEHELTVKVIDAELPPQKLKVTQWFHGDCLASYYDCKVFSQKWWRIVENFVRVAVRNGINTILTPVFTPPLDTAIGHERLTVQLVDIDATKDGYSFDYKNLDRWIRMCDRCGIKFFEISHLFTQWGAAHAPKIIAKTTEGSKQIFGWDTDASGHEYTAFIRDFIICFLDHMKDRGDDTRCLFHISDEPNRKNLEQYEKSRNSVIDLLKGYTVMDALSNVEFYQKGVVTTPIPSNNHIAPFIEAGVPGLWTYYCCGQSLDNVSNKFFAMPSWRNRAIGSQFFKYDIEGFLQWGYNFYNSQGSLSPVNPYLDSTGNYFVPSGDAYSVYPAQDGTAYESLRLVVFHEALNDLSAFRLCADLIGKDNVVAELESILGEIRFNNCARSAQPLLKAREHINTIIENGEKK